MPISRIILFILQYFVITSWHRNGHDNLIIELTQNYRNRWMQVTVKEITKWAIFETYSQNYM